MSSDETKVLLEIQGNRIMIQELVESPDGPALSARCAFVELGTVRKWLTKTERGGVKVTWQWMSEGFSGEASTKAKAIDEMLSDVGYVPVPIEATIPSLLDGLE